MTTTTQIKDRECKLCNVSQEQKSAEISIFRCTTRVGEIGWNLGDFVNKTRQKKVLGSVGSNLFDVQTFENSQTRFFSRKQSFVHSKVCTFCTTYSIDLKTFLHGFFHKDDRFWSKLRPDCSNCRSRVIFALRENEHHLGLDKGILMYSYYPSEWCMTTMTPHRSQLRCCWTSDTMSFRRPCPANHCFSLRSNTGKT